jgi:hypothetical protein
MKTKLTIIVTLLAVLILAACAPSTPPAPTPDAALIATSAAQTVVARFTLTAAAWTPTSAPLPTETSAPAATATQAVAVATDTLVIPLPGGTPGPTQVILCDRYTWDNATVDVNYPDGSQVQPGQTFIKTWKIKNGGTCTWGAGYKVVYAGYNDPMSGVGQAFGVVAPGQEVEISVQFTAPSKVGDYVSAWTLQNAQGRNFFGNGAKPLYIKITVKL